MSQPQGGHGDHVGAFSGVSADLQLMMALWLRAEELGALLQCNKQLHEFVESHDRSLFTPLCLALGPLSAPANLAECEGLRIDDQDLALKEEEGLQAFKSILGLKSLRQVYGALAHVGTPCTGLFIHQPHIPEDFATDFRGQLIRVRSDTTRGELIVEHVDPEGFVRPDCAFQLDQQLKPQCVSAGSRSLDFYNVGVRQWSRRENGELVLVSSRRESVYRPLPGSLTPTGMPHGHEKVLKDLSGLWTGTYGSHGEEIIYVRFKEPEGQGQEGGVMLEGLKLVGDANVPASQFSFRVDVSQRLNVENHLMLDPRLVYTFSLAAAARVRDLWHERRDIYTIYRGQGQINMEPGTWAPQLQVIDLVVYKSEQRKLSFSVVWQDEGSQLRHAIDFQRLSDVIRANEGGRDGWAGNHELEEDGSDSDEG